MDRFEEIKRNEAMRAGYGIPSADIGWLILEVERLRVKFWDEREISSKLSRGCAEQQDTIADLRRELAERVAHEDSQDRRIEVTLRVIKEKDAEIERLGGIHRHADCVSSELGCYHGELNDQAVKLLEQIDSLKAQLAEKNAEITELRADKGAFSQQAQAWQEVVSTLNECIGTGWLEGDGSGKACAVAAIKDLAEQNARLNKDLAREEVGDHGEEKDKKGQGEKEQAV